MKNAGPQHIGSPALPCLIAAPAAESLARPLPLLCFLHGRDEGSPAPIMSALRKHGPLTPGNPPDAAEFLIVAPQLPTQGDLWRRYGLDVRELVLEA